MPNFFFYKHYWKLILTKLIIQTMNKDFSYFVAIQKYSSGLEMFKHIITLPYHIIYGIQI